MVQMANIGGQPILILPEGTFRSKGKDAQRNNIAAGRAVADAVRSTIGPKGMDKMLVDSMGDVVITNDGATILKEMQIEHPAAKMMVEVAKTQDKTVGDGTTTAVVFGGELLKKAEELLDMEIHQTVITKGYRMAKAKTLEVLRQIARPVGIKDEEMLKKIAETAMTGKAADRASAELAAICMNAVKKVADIENGRVAVDIDNIKIEKKEGGSMADTILIDGVLIDKEVVHPGMPKSLKNARIALLASALEVKELEGDAKISIDSAEKMQSFLMEEERMLKDMVDKVVKAGANAVLCQKGIDDDAQHYLAKAGVLAARRVKKSDMELLARATGGTIITNLNDLTPEDLGQAGKVYEKKVADEQMIFVEECRTPKAVTILIRGGTEHVIAEVERAVEDAVKGIAAALDLGKIVAGGGATEIEVARQVRKYAESFKGREQLAVQAFADALEVIPRSLAENAGLDPIDVLANLRAEHDQDGATAGIDVFTGKVTDMLKMGVIEPLKTKLQAIESAGEAAEMILRIDDVIQASGSKGGGAPPGMPPGGMGGMGGMGDY